MFGYVTVYKNLLSESDYAVFRQYYCGLCRAIGRRCSQASRFGLSYDIAFLAIVLSSVEKDKIETINKPCIAHPFKKRESVINDAAVDYAADMGVMLEYLKLLDDWRDEKSLKALLGMMLFHSGMKKVSRTHKNSHFINEQLTRLSELEKANSSDIDECADCFAKILEALFTPDFITDTDTRRILAWFGYNIGRWIYVIDAVNDMEADYKDKKFNTFNAGFDGDNYTEYVKRVRSDKKLTLTFTLENVASAFELLNIQKNKSLLESMIYDCLKTKQSRILEGEAPDMKGNDNEPI